MERQFILRLAASVAFVALVLLLDGDGALRQLSLGAATTIFLLWMARRSTARALQIVAAIVVATAGEIVLSYGWGLYSYRHAVIAFYVPAGHGLFYMLAADTAAQASVRKHAKAIAAAVLTGGTVIALIMLLSAHDTWGFLWWIGAAALILRSRSQLLLSVCCVYTMALEWAGTSIGNWRWAPLVPFLGLRSANPPAGVGILYIILDVVVVLATFRLQHRPVPPDVRAIATVTP